MKGLNWLIVSMLCVLLSMTLVMCGDDDDDDDSESTDDDTDADDDSGCQLDCNISGDSLNVSDSCCTSSSTNCSYSYNGYGEVSGMVCTCGGHSFTCTINYNSVGQPSGSCNNEDGSCTF